MKITQIVCHVLTDPDIDLSATSSAQDDIVVEVHTDDDYVGIGETDVNPWIARACITAPGTHSMGQGLSSMLIGEDPLDVEALWDRLYVGSAMNGRRGAVINAIGAIDLALHDLRGKVLGKSVSDVLADQLGSATPKRSVVPYRVTAARRRQLRRIPGKPPQLVGGGQGARLQGGQAVSDALGPLCAQRHPGAVVVRRQG